MLNIVWYISTNESLHLTRGLLFISICETLLHVFFLSSYITWMCGRDPLFRIQPVRSGGRHSNRAASLRSIFCPSLSPDVVLPRQKMHANKLVVIELSIKSNGNASLGSFHGLRKN